MAQVASLCLNTILCIDLGITYLKPFEPSKKRMIFYILSTVVVVVFVTFDTFYTSTFLISPGTFFDKYVHPLYVGEEIQKTYT